MARWRIPDEATLARMVNKTVTASQKEKDYWARALADQIRHAGLPAPIMEYPFAKSIGRQYRSDLAWPSMKKLCEVDGAVHRIKARFNADIERDQIILQLGYTKLRVAPRQVRNGSALQLVTKFLQGSDDAIPEPDRSD